MSPGPENPHNDKSGSDGVLARIGHGDLRSLLLISP